jgi:hypothetical protein
VAILINNIAPLTELALWMHLHPFGRPTLIATFSAALCFGALPLVSRMAFGRSFALELAAATVGGVLYLALLWRWRQPLELKALLAIRKSRGRGRRRAVQPR